MDTSFILEVTEDTPEIRFEPEKNIFRLKGRSYPENAREFFTPINQWLKEYGKNTPIKMHVEIDLEYFNSGSVKELFGLLYTLEDIMEEGNEVKVTWYYEEGDELIYQKGLEFKNFLQLPIELIAR
ncbi:MAG: DUF1987 domain-containing protein [Crocinitomicaceae bacterium]